jgi:microcystin degradation protein MlrC
VVGSRAVSLYDRSFLYAHGQDPRHFDAVVVKSPHCQHHMFADWCVRMVNVDAPGSSSANLLSLGHTRCPRPIFPLDAHVPFTPQAKFFQRKRYQISAHTHP